MSALVASGGPSVLSVYEGFFSGGARVLHTSVVQALHTRTDQRHAALSLTDHARRESTVQLARHDAGHRRLVAAGVPVTTLRRGATDPLRPRHLAQMARAAGAADVVLSLKEQPLAALGRVDAGGRPVLTCLHRSDPEHQGAALETLVDLVERGVVRALVCCAESTRAAYHRATGIPLDLMPVVPNGVDLTRFRPSASDRASVRAELGIPDDAPLVLLTARFDPMKDVGLFLRAAEGFRRAHPDAHLVLCGAGMTAANTELVELARAALGGWAEASDRLHLLGIRTDMPRLHAAADLVVLTSAWGEAAPLSLLEGMAAGAVPVTTDVGDAALMVGDPRLVVAREATAVAAGWSAAYDARAEHRARILGDRAALSDQRCFEAYAALVAAHAGRTSLETAG